MNRKHLISLAAAATLLASLTACSSGDAEEPATDSNQDSADTGSNESEDTTTEDGGSEEGGASSGSGDFSSPSTVRPLSSATHRSPAPTPRWALRFR